MHPECFDLETSLYLIDNQDPFGFNQLRYIRDVEYSKSLNEKEGPMMIISASGMAEAGRVLHHLANTIENPNNMVLIVGYAPEHTLARRIRENDPEVKIFGDHYKLNAEVVVFNSLSAHADANELTAYAETLDKEALKDIFLVHGEYEQQSVFAKRLQDIGFDNVHIPNRGNSFTL
jgi:metallo-beta-lactamase family protein